jgi:hypothetical protein
MRRAQSDAAPTNWKKSLKSVEVLEIRSTFEWELGETAKGKDGGS